MSETAIAVENSTTSKMGPVSATYVSQNSCPPDCPFMGKGCYAEQGLVNFHTQRVNRADPTASPLRVAHDEANAIRTKLSGRRDLRLHVVGDCASTTAASIVSEAALSVTKRGRSVWTYTHAWRDVDRTAWADVNVLASVEDPQSAQRALDEGWAVAMVVPSFPQDAAYRHQGLKVLPCPNQTRGVQCVDCRLCWDEPRLRNAGLVIGFKPHGSRRKVVERYVSR
jgi:hypothetical protein